MILALAKKNYINKLFTKENIKTNKIKLKLIQFFGIHKKNSEDLKKENEIIEDNKNKEDKNTIKNNYENGLEIEINYEEKEELVKEFESQFFKSL